MFRKVQPNGSIYIGGHQYRGRGATEKDFPAGLYVEIENSDDETLVAIKGDESFFLEEVVPDERQSHTCGECDLCNDRGLCHRAEPYRYNEVWLIYPIVHLKCPACPLWLPLEKNRG